MAINYSLSEIAGRNARKHRLENGATLDAVAQAANKYGLKWTSGRVGDFESGRVSANLGTLIAVSHALHEATSSPISVGALMSHDGPVTINESLTVDGAHISESLQGVPTSTPQSKTPIVTHSLTDQRVAKDLGTTPDRLRSLSWKLWGTSFTEERNRRAGHDANAQKRGRVTREMKTELKGNLSGVPNS